MIYSDGATEQGIWVEGQLMGVNESEASAEHAGAAAEVAEARGNDEERTIIYGFGDQYVRDSTGAYVSAVTGWTYQGEVR